MKSCNKNIIFIVSSHGHIERRFKSGEFISSVCCRKCVHKLETAIKKLKEGTR